MSDHHLLCGLIATQVGLIDQGQLVAAFQAWARDKTRPLSDHLSSFGGIDVDARAAVNAMVALHVKRHGDAELTGVVAHIGSGATEPDGDGPDRTVALTVGTTTGDGRRFRVLRPHARGGLGAVFVALDGDLHREAALKQILDHHADDHASRRRFLLEAEIAGGLEHPGIPSPTC